MEIWCIYIYIFQICKDYNIYLEPLQHSLRRHGVVPVVNDELLLLFLLFNDVHCFSLFFLTLVSPHTWSNILFIIPSACPIFFTTTSTGTLAILHPLKLYIQQVPPRCGYIGDLTSKNGIGVRKTPFDEEKSVDVTRRWWLSKGSHLR